MSNEELVIEIQKGNTGVKNELWERVRKLVYLFCRPYQTYAAEKCLEMEDLMQAAWFGVERAIKAYNPDKGHRFNTYLRYHVQNVIRELLKLRGHREPGCVSLDETLDEDEELTRLDMLEDKAAAEAFTRSEDKQLAAWLWDKVDRLPEPEREVILAYYRDNIPLTEQGKQKACGAQAIVRAKNAGLHLLRKDREVQRFRREFEYHHVTLAAFKRTWTSATELAVINREQEGEARANQEESIPAPRQFLDC